MINLKMKSYKGGTLKGKWLPTTKLDGVCVLLDCPNRTAMSKRGKPLHNFEWIFEEKPNLVGAFEVFRRDWETTVSLVRTHNAEDKVCWMDLYPLDKVNQGMWWQPLENPTEEKLMSLLKAVTYLGNEGLVLVPIKADGEIDWTGKRVKVKPSITVDVRVTGVIEGTGKYTGMMGALMTKYGKVGTGFTDEQRVELAEASFDTGRFLIVDKIIEVEIMEWTKDGKMRHPRFIRVRWDKNTENLEGFKGDTEE